VKTTIPPVPVLLVEDNPADQELVRRALQRVGAPIQLYLTKDGEEAWSLLHTVPPSGLGFILLDLNLRGLSGHQLLQRLRADEVYRHVPVLILTTSTAPDEVRECYRLGCNSFLTKPAEFSDYVRLMQHLCHFWLEAATLPRG
jgi:CheY-like chemotaxis protein